MLTIRDIMTRDVKTLASDMSIRSAMDFLVANHLGGAPVVDGRTVAGVVSAADLLGFAASMREELPAESAATDARMLENERMPEARFEPASLAFFQDTWDGDAADIAPAFGTPEFAEWRVLDEHDVSEVMTREIWSLPCTATAREAAALMEAHGIHRVLVFDGDDLAGIVTSSDITRAVAKGKFNVRTYLFNHDREFG